MKIAKYFLIGAVAVSLSACNGGNSTKSESDQIEETEVEVTDAEEETDVTEEETDVTEEITDVTEDANVTSSYSNDDSSSSSSEDCDELLDSYEEYVDEYISYMKKAQQGDMDALSEYPALLEKAKEFSDRLSGVQDQMSSAQVNRYMKITRKMTEGLR